MDKEELKKFQSQRQLIHFTDLDIDEWVVKNWPFPIRTDPEMMRHASNMIKSMVNTYIGHQQGGSFVQAMCKEDYEDAFNRADDINRCLIALYRLFIVNHVPIVLRQEFKK